MEVPTLERSRINRDETSCLAWEEVEVCLSDVASQRLSYEDGPRDALAFQNAMQPAREVVECPGELEGALLSV